MNKHTILNIKTDKKLKEEAKNVAAELGVPLSTVVNAFLKQFVREREVTFSANELRPTQYLIDCIEEARKEYEAGEVEWFDNADDLLSALKSK